MKMILTGLLIYVPPTSRAGAAIVICFFCLSNLNYFRPNKQKPLFWLTYISFMVTGSKYVVALLLSMLNASTLERSVRMAELKYIGFMLIGLDFSFIASSLLCFLGCICNHCYQEKAKQTETEKVKPSGKKIVPVPKKEKTDDEWGNWDNKTKETDSTKQLLPVVPIKKKQRLKRTNTEIDL